MHTIIGFGAGAALTALASMKFVINAKIINCERCAERFYTNKSYRRHWLDRGHGSMILPTGILEF